MAFRFLLVGIIACVIGQGWALRTVIIDAGHGNQDVGGMYRNYYEKHFALDTALRLRHFLQKYGVRTVMTRTTDKYLSLEQRVQIAERYNHSIFVSIHFNFYWNRRSQGLETLYCRSYKLASLIQKYMTTQLPNSKNRGIKYRRDLYLLRHLKIPAVIVEGGFISNSRERNSMRFAWYRQSIAESVGRAILRYQGKDI